MTPKMEEALNKLVAAGSLPKSTFHHSTVTALLKGGHVEEMPGDSAWITPVAVRSEDLPQRDPNAPTVPIDDDVIASGRHVDVISTTATLKAWIVSATQTAADASEWRCRGRVKATRFSRRRAQRGAMAR